MGVCLCPNFQLGGVLASEWAVLTKERNSSMIPRVRTDEWMAGKHLTMERAFVLDTRSHDIPKTIVGMIRALPENCVGLSLRVRGGPAMVRCAESAARRRGIRVLWLVQ